METKPGTEKKEKRTSRKEISFRPVERSIRKPASGLDGCFHSRFSGSVNAVSKRGFPIRLWGWGLLILPLLLLEAGLIGCSGYQLGTPSLYTDEIKTVYVPMVEADSFRRDLGERLTEAVCKKITERTPFTLATSKDADSVLLIRLTAENQFVSALDAYNNSRQKNLVWNVTAEWRDRRENTLSRLDPIPLTSTGIGISETEYLVPETGQSGAVSQQDLIEDLANRIVGLMEEKW